MIMSSQPAKDVHTLSDLSRALLNQLSLPQLAIATMRPLYVAPWQLQVVRLCRLLPASKVDVPGYVTNQFS